MRVAMQVNKGQGGHGPIVRFDTASNKGSTGA
jgi:hypothetical protein